MQPGRGDVTAPRPGFWNTVMGLLEDGSLWLSDVFRSDDDVLVDYSRSPHDVSNTISVYATIGVNSEEQEPDAYVTQLTSNRDFLIKKNDLMIDAALHEPQPGDRIVETKDGGIYTYEVMEVPGDGPWRWHDVYYHTYRVHTTLISEQRIQTALTVPGATAGAAVT